MSARRALELIKLMPKPEYTGWRSDRQKAEAARAKAKAAEAKAEAEAKKAEAEAAPMRLMNQKKEADDKESQQNKGAQNKNEVETDVNDDSDDEVLATQDKVDNTDRPIGKRCVEKQSPVVAGSDLRDRKKARVVAVSVSKKAFFQQSQALETKVLELSTRLDSFEKTVEALQGNQRAHFESADENDSC